MLISLSYLGMYSVISLITLYPHHLDLYLPSSMNYYPIIFIFIPFIRFITIKHRNIILILILLYFLVLNCSSDILQVIVVLIVLCDLL